MNSIITTTLPRLQDAIESLNNCITAQPAALRDPPSSSARPPTTLDEYTAAVRRTLQYAHRLSYTTFAPPGYTPGAPLGLFRPPAPQEHQMCFSALHQLAGELANAQPADDTTTRDNATDPAAAITAMLGSMGIVLPPGFRPPPPPPGWKPGDAIEFAPDLLAQLAGLAAQAGGAAPEPAPAGARQGPPVAEEAMGMDFGLLLDGDDVELASEGSSDEEDDSDDAESL